MDPNGPLPEGTVTFLFTDIEGSTRLLQHLGERYSEVLADQRRLLRAAFQAHNGHELGTEGDSFFVAFSCATDALAAVVAAQQALAAHSWTDAAPVRVRMGLHSGEPTLTTEGYVGLDVHRAARVNACGHGGQILLSQRTRDLVERELPPGVSLKDLGAHRLKDLLHPEHLYQAVIEGLPSDFPPLKSLDAHPNNLPRQLSSFIGRERELAEARKLLGNTCLLTLVGIGGAGKTRLSLHLAAEMLEEYSDGVWLVELAALAEGTLVPQAVASALHLREEPGRTLAETIADYLHSKQALLLLDNCEHLVGGCARLAEVLLQRCPKLKVLATSREPLGLVGEVAWRVPSLPVPDLQRMRSPVGDEVAAVIQYAGVRLFLERGAAALPSFTVTPANALAVAEVCQRLDGIPLAIELAAARVKALPVEQISRRLDDRFRLLTGGSRTALPRQQTLRALIDWSHELLSEPEQVLLRRLSVFAGGWMLEAVEAVASGESIETWEVLDLLSALVEKSLVQYEVRDGQAWYRLLETVREYAREKLRQAGEELALRERHRDWFLRLAEQAEPELLGPAQQEWLDRLESAHDDLRIALDWSVGSGVQEGLLPEPEHLTLGLRLGGALWRFWWVRGHLTEGRERLAHLLARPSACPLERSKVLLGAGVLAQEQGDYELAQACYEESLAIRRRRADEPEGTAERQGPQGIAELLNLLGTLARAQGDSARAQQLFEESLSLLGERHATLRAKVLHNLALLASGRGDIDEELRLSEEALRYRRLAGDIRGEAETLGNLGALAQLRGNLTEARRLYQESLTLRRGLGDRHGIAVILNNLAELAELEGDLEAAIAFFVHAERLFRELRSVHAGIPEAALQRLADSLGAQRWTALHGAAQRTLLEEIVDRDTG